MTPLRFRPEALRVPWQAIAAFAAAVYLIRSTLRSWDFRPDTADLLVFGALALILAARPLAERLLHDDDATDAEDGHSAGDGGEKSSGE